MDEVAIYVLEGKNLIACDKGGTSDPYVKLAIGHNVKAQTKRIDKTLNPKWNETVYLKVQDASKQTLEVTVWDHDTFRKDDFMGQVNIQLYEAAQLGDSKKWYPLQPRKPEEHITGEVFLRILITAAAPSGNLSVEDLKKMAADEKAHAASVGGGVDPQGGGGGLGFAPPQIGGGGSGFAPLPPQPPSPQGGWGGAAPPQGGWGGAPAWNNDGAPPPAPPRSVSAPAPGPVDDRALPSIPGPPTPPPVQPHHYAAPLPPPPQAHQSLPQARTLYDWTAENAGEFPSLRAGDVVTITQDNGDPTWAFVSFNGQEGYIPHNYLERL